MLASQEITLDFRQTRAAIRGHGFTASFVRLSPQNRPFSTDDGPFRDIGFNVVSRQTKAAAKRCFQVFYRDRMIKAGSEHRAEKVIKINDFTLTLRTETGRFGQFSTQFGDELRIQCLRANRLSPRLATRTSAGDFVWLANKSFIHWLQNHHHQETIKRPLSKLRNQCRCRGLRLQNNQHLNESRVPRVLWSDRILHPNRFGPLKRVCGGDRQDRDWSCVVGNGGS